MSTLGVLELGLGDEDAGLGDVAAVEALRQFDQDVVALHEDALKDAGDGVGDGGVGLEPGGFETLAPLTQVEELKHSGLLRALGMDRGDGG